MWTLQLCVTLQASARDSTSYSHSYSGVVLNIARSVCDKLLSPSLVHSFRARTASNQRERLPLSFDRDRTKVSIVSLVNSTYYRQKQLTPFQYHSRLSLVLKWLCCYRAFLITCFHQPSALTADDTCWIEIVVYLQRYMVQLHNNIESTTQRTTQQMTDIGVTTCWKHNDTTS